MGLANVEVNLSKPPNMNPRLCLRLLANVINQTCLLIRLKAKTCILKEFCVNFLSIYIQDFHDLECQSSNSLFCTPFKDHITHKWMPKIVTAYK